jgi:anti-sigma factor RsiW
MTCPRNGTILRLLSGELLPDAAGEFQAHLKACATCMSAYEDLQSTWGALGDWRLDVSGIDLTDRVLADAEAAARSPVRATRWTAPLRAAASVILAVGLGIGAGRLVPQDEASPVPTSPPTVTGVDEAIAMIGLTAESVTGLHLSLDHEEPTEGGEMP